MTPIPTEKSQLLDTQARRLLFESKLGDWLLSAIERLTNRSAVIDQDNRLAWVSTTTLNQKPVIFREKEEKE